MVRENPPTLPIAALGWLVPLITLENTIREAIFVQSGRHGIVDSDGGSGR